MILLRGSGNDSKMIFFVLLSALPAAVLSDAETISMKIPAGQPLVTENNEDQWCTAYDVTSEPRYLKHIRPVDYGEQVTLLGCLVTTYPDGVTATPTNTTPPVWRCNNRWFVTHCKRLSQYNVGPTGDIGLEIGGQSGIVSLILAYHYHIHHDHTIILSATSDSGTVTFDLEPVASSQDTKLGDVLNMQLSSGVIPSHTTTSLEFSCHVNESVELHPYNATYHFHETAKAVDAWVQHPNGTRTLFAILRDPHRLQARMLLTPTAVIRAGDTVIVSCTYDNPYTYDINIGLGVFDEMCLIHFYYYVNDKHKLSYQNCF